MRVKFDANKPVTFTPVQLVLTFEAQEELNIFKSMCSWDLTIPDTCIREGGPNFELKRELLGSMLRLMSSALPPSVY